MRRIVFCLGAAALAALGLEPAAVAGPRVRYEGQSVVRIGSPGDADATDLPALRALGLDILSEHARDEVIARVPLHARAQLDASGIEYTIVETDLQEAIDREQLRLDARGPATAIGDKSFYDEFRDFDEVLLRLEILAAAAPSLVTPLELGSSLEGRPIRGLRIERAAGNPVIALDACQHAREWLTVSTTLAIAEALIDSASEAEASVASVDPTTAGRIDTLLDAVSFVIVPVANPDGYVHSWEVDRLWRKNRRDEHGVDLNRNWGVGWGGAGSSGDSESNNYRGTGAFSEPETAALRDLMRAESQLVAHIDFHTFGQLVLYPWGFGAVEAPDFDELAPLAELLGDALTATHGEPYAVLQGASFYPAAGNLPDWAYGELGARSFTIELRPVDSKVDGAGFMPSADQIVPTADEALYSVLALAEWAATAAPGEPGDDGEAPFDDGADANEDATDTGSDAASASESTGESPDAPADAPSTTENTGDGTDDGAAPELDGAGSEDDAGCGCSTTRARDGWLALFVIFATRRRPRPARRPTGRASDRSRTG